MSTLVKGIILILVFCVGFTLGQGHHMFDFDGNDKLTQDDIKTALQHLTAKR